MSMLKDIIIIIIIIISIIVVVVVVVIVIVITITIIVIIIIIVVVVIIIESLSQQHVFAGCSFSESGFDLEITGHRGQSIQSSSEDTSRSQQCCLLLSRKIRYTLVLPSTLDGSLI